eukprot:CAMPEP_0168524560 /NCGR_PEP_ID=MMETSP0405-20121227/10731_1 /TAXON_ID=498012 /ORGANISM="Trichosphaerium sp, Strain Am-I-7 wt" /LENGTH=556 /DNA_ID=CAMNT_0008546807 /DNA_START=69 /DNA_END=1739 /DNA_ORIENTATION=+
MTNYPVGMDNFVEQVLSPGATWSPSTTEPSTPDTITRMHPAHSPQPSPNNISFPSSPVGNQYATPQIGQLQWALFVTNSGTHVNGLSHGEPTTPTECIAQIHRSCIDQAHLLSTMMQQLKMLLNSPSQQGYDSMLALQHRLKSQIDQELQKLQVLNRDIILSPRDLQMLFNLHQDLQIQLKQLELLYHELQSLVNGNMNNCYCSLIVTKQPFPEVFKNGCTLPDDSLVVQMLTGSNVDIVNVGPVKASLVSDGNHAKKDKLVNNQAHLDNSKCAKFPLKLNLSTRKQSVVLKFSVLVHLRNKQGQVANVTIESLPSLPFVVITNESQWEDSMQILFKKDTFNGKLEIPWPQLCNTLQRHFLRATKQDLMNPKRHLNAYDFKYINERFFDSKSRITNRDFEKFWAWFGKCLHVVRYKRHIGSLWQQGLIYGFMSRDVVRASLDGQKVPGTFVIRFSEQYPGQFGIAYIGANSQQVKHYLVGANDVAGPRKTLPDFLAQHPQFLYILQVTFTGAGKPVFKRYPKDQCFAPYYSPYVSQRRPKGDGYDPLEAPRVKPHM